jgi:hypothetical protein
MLGPEAEFPLLVFRGRPPGDCAWPPELIAPSTSVREFYHLCDGGYFGGHHRLLSVGELFAENLRWWEMLAGAPTPNGEYLDANRHVILGCDECGFPLVWDQPTDLLARLDYRDTGALYSMGQTIGQFMNDLFCPDYPDDMWQDALRQLSNSMLEAAPATYFDDTPG